jgi:hypothetical protein
MQIAIRKSQQTQFASVRFLAGCAARNDTHMNRREGNWRAAIPDRRPDGIGGEDRRLYFEF